MSTSTLFTDYRAGASLDEAIDEDGRPRRHYRRVVSHIETLGLRGLQALQKNADLALLNQGITFTVYSDARGSTTISSTRWCFAPIPFSGCPD